MAPISLFDRTLVMLRNRGDLTLEQVCKGANDLLEPGDPRVEREWLSKFGRGQIQDPGVRKVEAVHNFLVSQNVSAEVAA